jgi:hypothetical protein
MIERLLSYLYLAYDQSPNPVIALRVGHEDGFAWTVANRQLTVATEAGLVLGDYDLTTLTIHELADELVAVGCTIIDSNAELQSRAAHSLLSGSSAQSKSNGDALFVYDSLLWSFIDGYANELDTVSEQISIALSQINYETVSGEFADVWGEYWGYLRRSNESDANYKARTINEIKYLRVNGVAMSNSATQEAGHPIRIYEPWVDLFYLSESSLDNEIIFDGIYWSPYLFRAVLRYPMTIDWFYVIDLLERMRPTGVFQLTPMWEPTIHVMPNTHFPCFVFDSVFTYLMVYNDRFLLDYSDLDGIVTANGLFNIYDNFSITNIKIVEADDYNRWLNYWGGRPWGIKRFCGTYMRMTTESSL